MKITIITPCSRPQNLKEIFLSINFDYVDKWIIVYDTTRGRTYTKQFEDHPNILEEECCDPGISGNPQRNHGLRLVLEGFVYFLDDDNIVHPDLWAILPSLDEDYFYTWDQLRGEQVIEGSAIEYRQVDTAMFLVPKKICKNLKWFTEFYEADYIFIRTIYYHNPTKHQYIAKTLSYYNKLTNS
jgi:hypothetical protein